ncbi:MAG: FHA domain-containing protein [Candidatus Margulisiibacteriota bacterium]
MVRVYGLVKGYTPVNVHMPEGNKVKINIRTDLLSPVGKTIVGTLHFNGTTVYIPKDSNLTIGSSPKCEIRLKDPAVELFHAMISSVGENVTIEHLLRSGKTAILSSSKEIKTIGAQDGPSPLVNGDKIVFALSGDKKLLAVDFKLRQSFEAEIQESLVNQLQPRPPIEQVSIEQASAGQALAKVEDQPLPLKAIVAGTPFAACRTIDDVLTLYPDKLERARKTDMIYFFITSLLCSGINLATSFLVLSSIDAIFNPAVLIPYLVTSVTTAVITSLIVLRFASSKARLNKPLADVLSKSDPDKVSCALAYKSDDERKKVLSVLEEYDPTVADAIKLRLPDDLLEIGTNILFNEMMRTPLSGHVRVEPPALPSTHKRVAEQPAAVIGSPAEEETIEEEVPDQSRRLKS